MANYNHEILVNYLRDVYSMELLVRKIEDDVHSTREDIQCEQALVEKVESTPIPAEGNISPKKDITPYMIAGFLILFISFGFFTLPSIGAISGILGIGVSIILFSCAGSVSSDNTKMQEEEKEKIFKGMLKNTSICLPSPMIAAPFCLHKSTIITLPFRTCRKQKKNYKAYIL